MPRPPRADEAGGLYHALNRGNLRADIFRKEDDFDAFEKILHERLQRYQIALFSYQRQFACPLSGAVRWEIKDGWNRFQGASIWSPPIRPRGRQRVHSQEQEATKEA